VELINSRGFSSGFVTLTDIKLQRSGTYAWRPPTELRTDVCSTRGFAGFSWATALLLTEQQKMVSSNRQQAYFFMKGMSRFLLLNGIVQSIYQYVASEAHCVRKIVPHDEALRKITARGQVYWYRISVSTDPRHPRRAPDAVCRK
jgi:hypothetical protein